jgi:hypothetical protein
MGSSNWCRPRDLPIVLVKRSPHVHSRPRARRRPEQREIRRRPERRVLAAATTACSRIAPCLNGTPLVVEVRSLTAALADVCLQSPDVNANKEKEQS